MGMCCYVINAGGPVLGRKGEEGEVEVGVRRAERARGRVGVGGGGHGVTGERARGRYVREVVWTRLIAGEVCTDQCRRA